MSDALLDVVSRTPLVLLQAEAPSAFIQLFPLVLIMGIFYVLVFLPGRRKQQEHQKMLEALSKGDRVITNGGLYAEVVSVDAQTTVLKISDGVKVKVAKSAISALENQETKS